MATLLEDLTDIEEKAQGLVENKVANFSYTQEAYDNDDVDGVSEYNVNKAQNIPTAEAETLDVNPTVLNKGYRSQASSITRMLMNHFLGRTSYNLNKSVDLFKKGFLSIKNALGKPNGIATLDENGYLSKEQTKPVLTDEKLSEFLLSDKEAKLKELGMYFHSSMNVNYVFSFSISDTEDIILLVIDSSFEVYKYDGENYTYISTSQTGNTSLHGEYKGSLGRYDDKEIFYVSNRSSNPIVKIVYFDYWTLRFNTITLTTDYGSDNVFLNTEKGKVYAFPYQVSIYVDNKDLNMVDYTLLDLNSLSKEEGYFYVPNIASIPVASAAFNIAMNENLLILYQTTSNYGYQTFIYNIDNLSTSVPTTDELNILGSKISYSTVFIKNSDSSIILSRPNSGLIGENNRLMIINKGKITLLLVSALYTIISDISIKGNAIVVDQVLTGQNNKTLFQIYSLDGTKNFFSIKAPLEVYKNIILIDNSYVDLASANLETVHKDYPLEKIIKSNRRAYTLKKNSEDKLYLNEITNVLD